MAFAPPLILSDIDSSTILIVFGALFGVFSILYFARDILASLSVTVKSLLLYSLSVLGLAISVAVSSSIITLLLVVFCGVIYTAATVYVWKLYDFGKVRRFLLLVISSIALIGTGVAIQNNVLSDVDTVTVVGVGVVPALIALAISVVDILEETGIRAEVALKERISELDQRDQVVGSITVTNESYLRREYNTPQITVVLSERGANLPCKIGPELANRDVQTLGSGQKISASLSISPHPFEQEYDIDLSKGCRLTVVGRGNEFQIEQTDEDIEVEMAPNNGS